MRLDNFGLASGSRGVRVSGLLQDADSQFQFGFGRQVRSSILNIFFRAVQGLGRPLQSLAKRNAGRPQLDSLQRAIRRAVYGPWGPAAILPPTHF